MTDKPTQALDSDVGLGRAPGEVEMLASRYLTKVDGTVVGARAALAFLDDPLSERMRP